MAVLVRLRRQRRDPGRALARLVCGGLALVGLLPLVLALVVRMPWARQKMTALVQRELRAAVGLTARFDLQIELLPPAVVLSSVQVAAVDGTPAITIDQARVAPRLFSLLGGHPNVGDVEIIHPQVKLRFVGGRPVNLPLQLPASSEPSGPPEFNLRHPPLRSLAVERASVQVTLVEEGVSLDLGDLDADVTLGDGAVDLSLHLGESHVHRRRIVDGRVSMDDDTVCSLQARVHHGEDELLVRHLELAARLDHDDADGPGPGCDGEALAGSSLKLALNRLHIRQGTTPLPMARGHIEVEAPLRIVNRYAQSPPKMSGDVALSTDLTFAGREGELPESHGHLSAREFVVQGKRTVLHSLEATLDTTTTEIRIPEGKAAYADGEVTLRGVKAWPLRPGLPVWADEVAMRGVQFPGLMRDTGITRHTIVKWTLAHGAFTNFGGMAYYQGQSREELKDVPNLKDLVNLKNGPNLIGDVWVDTEDFELSPRAWDDPLRRRVVGVKKAKVRGRFGARPDGILFRQMVAEFGRSRLDVPQIDVGFEDNLNVVAGPGNQIELGDITPVGNLPVGGRLEFKGGVCCLQSDPTATGELKVTGLQMAGLPLADTATGHAVFKPFILELSQIAATKGHSAYTSPRIRVDFERPQGMLVEGNLSTAKMDFRDLLAIFQFEKDPRYAKIFGTGSGQAALRFELGGPGDPCDTGVISMRAHTRMEAMSLYDECYDGGEADLDFTWFDRKALERGIDAEIHALTLRKGTGVITGAGAMRQGAVLTGHFTAQDIPLLRVDGFIGAQIPPVGPLVGKVRGARERNVCARLIGSHLERLDPDSRKLFGNPLASMSAFKDTDVPAIVDLASAIDGTISATGHVGGTVESPEMDAAVRMSPIRMGQRSLPASSMDVRLVPTSRPAPAEGARVVKTRCDQEVPRVFDLREYERDDVKGVYHTDGELFGGQIKLLDVQTTWQREKRVTGEIRADRFDLGALLQLSPSAARSERPPSGELSGRTVIERMELDHLDRTVARFEVEKMEVRQGSSRVRLKVPKGSTSVAGRVERDTLSLERMGFELGGASEVGAEIELAGRVSRLTKDRLLDLEVRLPAIEIGPLLESVPKVEAATGRLEGSVTIQGRADAPVARGELRLKNGSLAVRGAPVVLDEIDVLARVDEQELRIVRAMAKVGGGQLQLSARAPLKGLALGELSAQLEARGVRWPVSEGVEMVADASLATTWAPPGPDGVKRRARLTGSVTLDNFLYTRPIGVAADLDALARKGKRTEVVVYDPEEDVVDLSIRISSPRPLVFRNNLLEAEVALDSSLLMTGTNQRFGLQGSLRVNPGSRLRLRSNEFDIRQGTIRFEDPLRIAPRVDLQASTDYRRASTSTGGGGPPGAGAPGGGPTAAAGGFWRILLHAYGDADNLKLDLTSDPNLAQEDIILLLTVGMTRAELDQLQASNLGSTAALEALSALSGADSAVKTVLPIIDDFRFGSAYSSRTGRTEPTVTVGKRISERFRANVVTGLSENRDVRSNVEWRFTPGTSILGNYDNLSDVASRGLGNLGADFRVRLEFLGRLPFSPGFQGQGPGSALARKATKNTASRRPEQEGAAHASGEKNQRRKSLWIRAELRSASAGASRCRRICRWS